MSAGVCVFGLAIFTRHYTDSIGVSVVCSRQSAQSANAIIDRTINFESVATAAMHNGNNMDFTHFAGVQMPAEMRMGSNNRTLI